MEPLNDAIINMDERPAIHLIVGANGETVLTVDEEGILYKGERARDAGQAYKMLIDFLMLPTVEKPDKEAS